MKIKNFFYGILYIILYFFLTIVVYSTFSKHIYDENNLLLANVSTICADLIILFIFIILFRKTIIPDFKEFKINFKNIFKDNFKYYIIVLSFMLLSNLLLSIFIQDIPTNEELNREILQTFFYSSLFSMVIVAPIIEEAITKIYFRKTFNNKWLFVIFSGLLFAALHMLASTTLIELLFIIPYMALGSSLAYIYYKSNNIWANILFHSLHNTIAIIILLIEVL